MTKTEDEYGELEETDMEIEALKKKVRYFSRQLFLADLPEKEEENDTEGQGE